MKRVFKIDILTCEHCGGAVKVAALAHLERSAEPVTPAFGPFARAAAAGGMTGPEGTRLTVLSSDLRRDARLV